MRLASQVCLAAVLLTGTAVMAQDIQPLQGPPTTGYDDTYQRHFGFYIRPDLGFGYLTSTGPGVTISGLAGLTGIAIGGAIRENSILAVHIIGAAVQNPGMSSGGLSATANDTTVTLWGIGPQYTHYFMPSDLYLSTTLALTRLHSSYGNNSGDSDWGVGTRIANPSSRPFRSGSTSPTATAAPVVVGIMDNPAARARRRSLCGRSRRF